MIVFLPEALIEKYEDRWDWEKFSSNEKFLNLITKYGENLIHQIASNSRGIQMEEQKLTESQKKLLKKLREKRMELNRLKKKLPKDYKPDLKLVKK